MVGKTPGAAQLEKFRETHFNQEIQSMLADNRMAIAKESPAGGKTQPYAVRVSDHGGDFNLYEAPIKQTEVPNKTIHRGDRKRRYEAVVSRYNRRQAWRQQRDAERDRMGQENIFEDPWGK
jgi:hypothetical protein